MNFGEILKKVLDEMNVSQRSLAASVGKEPSYISRIINEKVNVSWDTINSLAEALGINPGVFFATEDEMLSYIVDELPEDTKEFIRNRQNQTWIYLAKDLKESGFSVKSITSAVELLKELDNK